MTNLKKIQLLIVINDFKIVTFVNLKVTRNVISFKFVTKHEVKIKKKRLALKLYDFDEKRIKEKVNQKVTIQIKIISREVLIIFNVMNYVKNALLKYF